MKRLSVFITTSFIGLALSVPVVMATNRADSQSASNSYAGSSNCVSGCDTSVTQNYPPPYTGGAPVAKVFHPSDGSTVTITATGAVIKQGSNGTPYREGWINPANMGNFNTSQDLQGRLAYGGTNPYLNNSTSSSSSINYASATASYSTPGSYTNTTPASTTQTTSAPNYQQTTTTPTYSSTGKTLPNTGPGGVIPLAVLATIFGTAGHYLYSRRRL